METIEENLGYQFKDPALLIQALTRKAFANEEKQQGRHHEDQEILTTLGDAVLKTVFVELLIRARYPTPDAITQAKIQLEHKGALAGIAGQMGIARSIRLGIGERKEGVVEKGPDVLAETHGGRHRGSLPGWWLRRREGGNRQVVWQQDQATPQVIPNPALKKLTGKQFQGKKLKERPAATVKAFFAAVPSDHSHSLRSGSGNLPTILRRLEFFKHYNDSYKRK